MRVVVFVYSSKSSEFGAMNFRAVKSGKCESGGSQPVPARSRRCVANERLLKPPPQPSGSSQDLHTIWTAFGTVAQCPLCDHGVLANLRDSSPVPDDNHWPETEAEMELGQHSIVYAPRRAQQPGKGEKVE